MQAHVSINLPFKKKKPSLHLYLCFSTVPLCVLIFPLHKVRFHL